MEYRLKQLSSNLSPWASILESFIMNGISQEQWGRMNLYACLCLCGGWSDEHGEKRMSEKDLRRYGMK